MLTELVDDEFYLGIYGGSSMSDASPDLFKFYSRKASSKVNFYTSNRITEKNNNDDVKFATCEIIDLLFSQDKLKSKIYSDDKIIASETVGPHTVNYVNKSTIQSDKILSDKELDLKCYQICYEHLIYTGLMDRGVRKCSHIQ